MKSFFKFESKEDKEVRRRMKKHGEVSFNTTMSPDCDQTTDTDGDAEISKNNESMDNLAKSMSLKLQSGSKSSIDSSQIVQPILPKPKKGISRKQ